MDLTLVTMYYNLKRREPYVDRRDAAFYLQKGERVLSLPYPMVIFTDREFFWHMVHARTGKPTVVVPLEELPNYDKLYPRLMYNFATKGILDSKVTKDTPLYMLNGAAKYDHLLEVIAQNPFKTNNFGWIDFGVSYVADFTHVEEALAVRPAKCRMVMLNHYLARAAPQDVYYRRLPWICAAGFFLGPTAAMQKHCQATATEFQRAVAAGYCPTDEQVMGQAILADRQNYEFAYGDYYSLFSNFAGCIRANVERAIAIIQQAAACSDWPVVCEIGQAIWPAVVPTGDRPAVIAAYAKGLYHEQRYAVARGLAMAHPEYAEHFLYAA